MPLGKGGVVPEPQPVEVIRLETTDGSTDVNQNTLFPWTEAPLLEGPFAYNSGDRYMTVQQSGRYEAMATIAISTGGSERDNPNATLYKNRTSSQGSGTQLPAGGKSGYIRQNGGHNESSVHFTWVGDLAAGDTLAVQMRPEASNGNRGADTGRTNMTVRKL